MLAAIPKHFFGLPFAEIHEKQCACDGADGCVYEIKWVSKPLMVGGWIGLLAGLAAGAVAVMLAGWDSLIGSFVFGISLLGYFSGRYLDYKGRFKDVYLQNERQAASLLGAIRVTEKLNEELHRKVEQRTEELSKSNKDLQQTLNELKESQEKILIAEKQAAIGVLASGMAHEMNNPINAIRLCIQSLQDEVGGTKSLSSQFEVAQRAVKRCARVINELLLFSREPGQILPTSFAEIVESSVNLFRKESLGETVVDCRCSVGLTDVRLDKLQIQQVILNLLANAADAMGGKGRIEVLLAEKDNNLELHIKDHGTGISDADRKKIFDPFFTTKKTGKGMGLGLSITYQLVRRNGGTISVESREGEGSTFIVRFPTSASSADHPVFEGRVESLPVVSGDGDVKESRCAGGSESAVTAPLSRAEVENRGIQNGVNGVAGIRLLLVEDDRESGWSMKTILEKRGMVVTLVERVEDAIAKLEATGYDVDVIVTDIRMEGMSGIDLLKHVRRRLPEFPMVLITGYDSMESAIQAVRLGAQDYILKPFESIEQVIGPVMKAVRNYRLITESKRTEDALRNSHRQLQALVARLHSVREEERTNISRQIHDELGHAMTGLKMNLSWLYKRIMAREVTGAGREEAEKIQSMIPLVDGAIKTTRKLATELRPGLLDHLGLEAAIEWQAEEFQRSSEIECKFIFPDERIPLSPDQSTGMFRILQEILVNVARHAGATRVDICLAVSNSHLVLEVHDNGRGITTKETSDPTSLGLLGMRERARLLGGTVAIDGAVGKGTTITVLVPLDNKERKSDENSDCR